MWPVSVDFYLPTCLEGLGTYLLSELVAAGPVGRDASVNGAVYGFAPIFSYSKSAGLFAGVSLEGTVIIGRRDADSKFYGGLQA
jgi:lipid-binding SYLF domain-containing protein